jgi:hypothetical protein
MYNKNFAVSLSETPNETTGAGNQLGNDISSKFFEIQGDSCKRQVDELMH